MMIKCPCQIDLETPRSTNDNTDGADPSSSLVGLIDNLQCHIAPLRGIWIPLSHAVAPSKRRRQCRDPGACCRYGWRDPGDLSPARVHARGVVAAEGGGFALLFGPLALRQCSSFIISFVVQTIVGYHKMRFQWGVFDDGWLSPARRSTPTCLSAYTLV